MAREEVFVAKVEGPGARAQGAARHDEGVEDGVRPTLGTRHGSPGVFRVILNGVHHSVRTFRVSCRVSPSPLKPEGLPSTCPLPGLRCGSCYGPPHHKPPRPSTLSHR